MKVRTIVACCLVCALLTGCGDDGDPAKEDIRHMDQPGPFAVSVHTSTMTDASRERTMTVRFWYPAANTADIVRAAQNGFPIQDFIQNTDLRTEYGIWLKDAPPTGPTTWVYAAVDADVTKKISSFPLIMFSHCMNCIGFATTTLAQRLASHGFVVAAPDHTGGTMFENGPMNTAFLETRAADISFVLDTILAGTSEAVPEGLRGHIDPNRVGMYGHSFGATTTGKVLSTDGRVKAGAALAAPMENPALQGVEMDDIDEPLLFFEASEDNMISYLGNGFIDENVEEASPPVYRVIITDAGHMSFTDICGVKDTMVDGCVDTVRQLEPYDPFTFIGLDTAHDIAMAYLTAFMYAYVLEDSRGLDYLAENHFPQYIELTARLQ